ncbi:carbonic anhydrase [Streptomyces sp. SID13666]|uniref:carbonic anhydrase n=1 Tax=unclassified Streptomyces TaxID=2593676 RepID=UPI0013C24235|nr:MULTISPECIES: carbonic anhydrase [unclassified Streptomyces]NEA53347.1 carbonic anhydrase [Streptomyces sp. SID13666]NEA69326.1 carbonic anhydrase [Streptomyces sp. SID13588]
MTEPAVPSRNGAPSTASAADRGRERGPLTPEGVLQWLLEGNRRWVSGQLAHPRGTVARREALAAGQDPMATVFSCIDSRVPPEIVFDCGIGDLFVVRTAAHTNDGLVQGAVEYGVDEALTPLLVVMGHQRCGAVGFAVETLNAGREAPAHLEDVVEALRPAYDAAKPLPGDQVDNTVRAQIRLTVEQLHHDSMLEPLEAQGRARVIGAYYSLDSGAVEFHQG